ncbi:MAG: sensor domain-containing diguanylate cyclase [Actinomycetota bacterium]
MVKRVLSLVAWLLAVAALLLTAAPAAIAQDDLPGPPDEPPLDDGFQPGVTYTYPPEWDPELNDDVVLADHLAGPGFGLVMNVTTRDVYDPVIGEMVRGADGAIVNYATGEVIQVIPELANPPLPGESPFAPVDGEPVPVEPVDEANVAEPVDEPVEEPTAEAGPAGPGDGPRISEFEDADDVLAFYRTGFTAEDLAPYAVGLDDLPIDALDDTFQFLAYEIALLFEAGAFARETPWFDTFAELHSQFDFDDAPADALISTFTAVDLDFERRSLLYRDAIDPVEEWSVDWAIAELDGDFYDMLVRRERGFLVGFEYAAALLRVMAAGPEIELVSNGAAENVQLQAALGATVEALELQQDINELLRADNDELRELLADLTAPSVTTALAVLDGPPAAETPPTASDDRTLIYAAGGGAAVLLVLAFLLLRRGRRRARTEGTDVRDEAMATNQLLAGAKNDDEIVGILERAGRLQVKAPLVLFHAVPDGLRRAGASEIIVGSDLQRVVSTGQQAKTTLHDDPAFPGRDQAVLALPVIHGGTVQAVLAAHRDPSEPLGDTERAAMEPIAPALGGALERSAELGTMSKLAMVDGLTSLGNRRRLDGDLETTLATAVAGDELLGFAMIDVDHFKTYNDTHGHTAGDEVLRRVAATIARSVRESDVVYRYGGEEFSMLLPGATPDEVAAVAERVRSSVEAEEFLGEELQPGGRLTVSIGVATLATGTSEDIRERADSALYRAKENGRNQVAYA